MTSAAKQLFLLNECGRTGELKLSKKKKEKIVLQYYHV